jgi:hypothetical protein
MKKREAAIIWALLLVCVLFFASPVLIRIPFIYKVISWYFDGLESNDFKSSYMSSIGVTIGTIMTIMGTLIIQKVLDKNIEKEKELKRRREIEDSLKIVYNDLNRSFAKILFMEVAIQGGSSTRGVYIDVIRNTKFYLDSNWRERVLLLDEVLEKKTVEKIIDMENKKEIFVIRPSKDLRLKRIEKDIDKLQAMYDLGISDCNKCLQELKEYIG